MAAEPFISRNIHPTVIVRAYYQALEAAMKVCEEIAVPVDIENRAVMMDLLRSTIGTKFSSRFGDLIVLISFSFFSSNAIVWSCSGQCVDGDGQRQSPWYSRG